MPSDPEYRNITLVRDGVAFNLKPVAAYEDENGATKHITYTVDTGLEDSEVVE